MISSLIKGFVHLLGSPREVGVVTPVCTYNAYDSTCNDLFQPLFEDRRVSNMQHPALSAATHINGPIYTWAGDVQIGDWDGRCIASYDRYNGKVAWLFALLLDVSRWRRWPAIYKDVLLYLETGNWSSQTAEWSSAEHDTWIPTLPLRHSLKTPTSPLEANRLPHLPWRIIDSHISFRE